MKHPSILLAALLLSILIAGPGAPVAGADDDKTAAPAATTTFYQTFSAPEFNGGRQGSPHTHLIESTSSGDRYYSEGLIIEVNATLTKIQIWGKFGHSHANNNERVAVTLHQAKGGGWELKNTFRSTYNAAKASSFVWQTKNVSVAVEANKPYKLELFIPGVGDNDFEIIAVRLEFQITT